MFSDFKERGIVIGSDQDHVNPEKDTIVTIMIHRRTIINSETERGI